MATICTQTPAHTQRQEQRTGGCRGACSPGPSCCCTPPAGRCGCGPAAAPRPAPSLQQAAGKGGVSAKHKASVAAAAALAAPPAPLPATGAASLTGKRGAQALQARHRRQERALELCGAAAAEAEGRHPLGGPGHGHASIGDGGSKCVRRQAPWAPLQHLARSRHHMQARQRPPHRCGAATVALNACATTMAAAAGCSGLAPLRCWLRPLRPAAASLTS